MGVKKVTSPRESRAVLQRKHPSRGHVEPARATSWPSVYKGNKPFASPPTKGNGKARTAGAPRIPQAVWEDF